MKKRIEELKVLIEKEHALLVPIKAQMKPIQTKIKTFKTELKKHENSLMYEDFDSYMKKFYSKTFSNREADDIYEFRNRSECLDETIFKSMFNDFDELNRYQTYDTIELLYDDGKLENYLTSTFKFDSYLCERILYSDPTPVKTIEEISEEYREEFKKFIDVFCSISFGSFKMDW
jgi:hypothetical protein